jgi:hypothetical protein
VGPPLLKGLSSADPYDFRVAHHFASIEHLQSMRIRVQVRRINGPTIPLDKILWSRWRRVRHRLEEVLKPDGPLDILWRALALRAHKMRIDLAWQGAVRRHCRDQMPPVIAKS